MIRSTNTSAGLLLSGALIAAAVVAADLVGGQSVAEAPVGGALVFGFMVLVVAARRRSNAFDVMRGWATSAPATSTCGRSRSPARRRLSRCPPEARHRRRRRAEHDAEPAVRDPRRVVGRRVVVLARRSWSRSRRSSESVRAGASNTSPQV
jgi:hypothetical protein